jgi:hypothetical protein
VNKAKPVHTLFWDLHLELHERCQKISLLIDAAVSDFDRLPAALEMMRAYLKLRQAEGGEVNTSATERMEELLPLLEGERLSGFSFYFGLATIAIWSSLEAYVDDVLAKYIDIDESVLQRDAIRKIKVSIGEYVDTAPGTRGPFLISVLERELAASMKPGVGRFEALLDAVGLGGGVDDELRACILELACVRNVLVHRKGLADTRLSTNCPWLSFTPNESVRVSSAMMHMYQMATSLYGIGIYRRVLSRLGEDTTRVDGFVESVGPLVKRTRGLA